MPNGRPPLVLMLGLVAAIGVELFVVQPYSVPSPWQPYVAPARRYLQAALVSDSAALERQSVSTVPVAWALHAARMAPETMAVWGAVLVGGEPVDSDTWIRIFPPIAFPWQS